MIDLEEHEFSVGLVALIFFNQSPQFLKYHEVRLIDSEGQPIGRRNSNNRGGDRKYTLEDIRQIAFVLRHRGVLTDDNLKNCIQRIDSMRQPVFQRKKT